MKTCTFFGHSDAPESIKPLLFSTLTNLIESDVVNTFFVGNHGNFDRMVARTLEKLKMLYPHIKYSICLAYLPRNKELDYSNTIYPEGLENTPPKFAIIKRNEWMLKRADLVVIYMTHTCGGTAKFAELAKVKNKTIINIAENINKQSVKA